jgi:hypothetical protein
LTNEVKSARRNPPPRIDSQDFPGRSCLAVDTIKTLAGERHFFTVELQLRGFGQVLLIGDQGAVERVTAIIAEHAEHELVELPLPLPHSVIVDSPSA